MAGIQKGYKNHLEKNKNIKNEGEKKEDKKTKKDSNLTFNLIILAVLAYFAFTLYSQQIQLGQLRKDYDEISYEYNMKEKELIKLNKQLKNVDSKEFIEKQARENLKMVKPNEKVYVDTNKSENLNDNMDLNK